MGTDKKNIKLHIVTDIKNSNFVMVVMWKPKNVLVALAIIIIFLIMSLLLVSQVNEYESETTKIEVAEAKSKSLQEIASLESVILSMKSDATLMKASSDDAIKAYHDKELRHTKQIVELKRQLE